LQTFLPYPDFKASAECLDYQRLGCQRKEVVQILNRDFPHHPAVKMWQGHEYALIAYGLCVIQEWEARGYKNNISLIPFMKRFKDTSMADPHWMGDTAFHDSHKSNLLRKFPEYYNRYGWTVSDDLPYVWPKELTR